MREISNHFDSFDSAIKSAIKVITLALEPQFKVQLPTTANPPHRLSLELGVLTFTRIASRIYDLSLPGHYGECNFLGRIEQKSDRLWAVTYIDCQSCMPEYFDDWQQATLFLVKLGS